MVGSATGPEEPVEDAPAVDSAEFAFQPTATQSFPWDLGIKSIEPVAPFRKPAKNKKKKGGL